MHHSNTIIDTLLHVYSISMHAIVFVALNLTEMFTVMIIIPMVVQNMVAKGSVVGSLESSGNGPGEVGEDGEGGDCRTAEDEESGHPDDLQSKFPVTNKRNQHK